MSTYNLSNRSVQRMSSVSTEAANQSTQRPVLIEKPLPLQHEVPMKWVTKYQPKNPSQKESEGATMSNSALSPASIDFLRLITQRNVDGSFIKLPTDNEKEVQALFPNIPWDAKQTDPNDPFETVPLNSHNEKGIYLEAHNSLMKDGYTTLYPCVYGSFDNHSMMESLKRLLFSSSTSCGTSRYGAVDTNYVGNTFKPRVPMFPSNARDLLKWRFEKAVSSLNDADYHQLVCLAEQLEKNRVYK